MRRIASFVAVLLLLITAAPVLACATDSTMSHAERACCRAMHGNCGEMVKMGCCSPSFHADVHPQQAMAAPHLHLAIVLVAVLVPVAVPSQPALDRALFRFPDEHSPPGLIIARTTVLRI